MKSFTGRVVVASLLLWPHGPWAGQSVMAMAAPVDPTPSAKAAQSIPADGGWPRTYETSSGARLGLRAAGRKLGRAETNRALSGGLISRQRQDITRARNDQSRSRHPGVGARTAREFFASHDHLFEFSRHSTGMS